jgi:hypothetical protein
MTMSVGEALPSLDLYKKQQDALRLWRTELRTEFLMDEEFSMNASLFLSTQAIYTYFDSRLVELITSLMIVNCTSGSVTGNNLQHNTSETSKVR